MDRFDRQRRIAGWDQDRIQNSRVLVCGRGWLGTFAVWGLASLGVGEILWVGLPRAATDPLVHWLLAQPSPFAGCAIHDYPLAVEYGAELTWIAARERIDVIVACPEQSPAYELCSAFAGKQATLYCATSARGGWVGRGLPPTSAGEHDYPVTAMVAAALVVDAVRETLTPLLGGRTAEGCLAIVAPGTFRGDRCLLVGVGGIGVYAATLAAAIGLPIHLIDDDQVDTTNLNRQGLFSPDDVACSARKAHAARDALKRFFPNAPLSAAALRADANIGDVIAGQQAPIVLSAVDNAETRLILQAAGRTCRVPVIQGGTDVFLADVYTQETDGTPLDQQMRGTMIRSRTQEVASRLRPRGGCGGNPSYVVPGMIAAGLMIHRALQVSELHRGLGPIHWRAGGLPIELRPSRQPFDFEELA